MLAKEQAKYNQELKDQSLAPCTPPSTTPKVNWAVFSVPVEESAKNTSTDGKGLVPALISDSIEWLNNTALKTVRVTGHVLWLKSIAKCTEYLTNAKYMTKLTLPLVIVLYALILLFFLSHASIFWLFQPFFADQFALTLKKPITNCRR